MKIFDKLALVTAIMLGILLFPIVADIGINQFNLVSNGENIQRTSFSFETPALAQGYTYWHAWGRWNNWWESWENWSNWSHWSNWHEWNNRNNGYSRGYPNNYQPRPYSGGSPYIDYANRYSRRPYGYGGNQSGNRYSGNPGNGYYIDSDGYNSGNSNNYVDLSSIPWQFSYENNNSYTVRRNGDYKEPNLSSIPWHFSH